MSRLQNIENALAAINDAVFQELCDSFLSLRNDNYKAFVRLGSQTGKQKTTKGTPDSLLLLPNGKYILVEYSTNVSKRISKLKEDIEKCINVEKTDIPIDKIEEIIFCINFNLEVEEIKELEELLSETRIKLTYYTLDSLSLELHLQHPNLIREYLRLPLDTGQIVSIYRFIEEYDKASRGIAAPLNNPFLHREKELQDLKNLISQNDLTILCGSPGVGKTKLALETIKDFLKENLAYSAFCISYKNTDLIEDLHQCLDTKKDYILFIDDANRIDIFGQIIGFYKCHRTGNLKILITVRDYALNIVEMFCQDFSPKLYSINKFTDEQIIDIVKKEPFDIQNSQYHKEIVRIADGNPRLAIMTALLSKEKQDLYALADVSDLFEKYFSTFIKDNEEFANINNIKILGIIAFFHAIPYKDKKLTINIFENFGIDYNTFVDCIERLDKLELVEIKYEHIRIPEQNLSTYFFYISFIRDNLLSFEILLDKYFDSNTERFTDCVIPSNNTFGYENVMEKIQPVLQKYWCTIRSDEGRSFRFLYIFWFYMQNEALEFVYNIIDVLPKCDNTSYELKDETKDSAFKQNPVIKLMGKFFHLQNNLKNVIELSFEYVRKSPLNLQELIHKIEGMLIFNWNDEQYGFYRQNILFEVLIKGLNNNDTLYSKAFFELSKLFLSFEFHQTEGGRNHTINFCIYNIPNNNYTKEFRRNIWENIDKNFSDDAFALLQDYAKKISRDNKEVMEYDIPFVIRIIENRLNSENFLHCKYVQEQISWYKKHDVFHPNFNFLCSKFTNSLYEMSLKINWNKTEGKRIYNFGSYEEYEKMKRVEIINAFIFKKESDLKVFYQNFVYLNSIKDKNGWNYSNTLDVIIDENCNKNFKLGCKLLEEIIENNVIGYIPRCVFRNQLTTEEKIDYIWNILQSKDFKDKSIWEIYFYSYIPISLVTNKYIASIKNSFLNLNYTNTILLDDLQKFINLEPRLFEDLLQIIVGKNEKEEKIYISMNFFDKYFEQLGDNINLIKKAYIQQITIRNHSDYQKKGFQKILSRDSHFLVEYVEVLYLEDLERDCINYDSELKTIWQINNIELTLEEVFDLVSKNKSYNGILGHYCNIFFANLKGELKEKAKKFLIDYCKDNYNDYDKINIVVDIARHSMKEFYEDILLEFISLTQDVNLFSRIWWRGNGGCYEGNVCIGDIEASEWRNILSIVEKSDVGFKLIPIKQYIDIKIKSSLRYADSERRRMFMGDW